MSNITTIRVSGQTYTISDSRLAEVEEVTAAALNYLEENKQDTLSAGTGIQISGNVISATGGGGGGNNVIEVTQAEYDALVSAGTLDLTALYVITDATEIDISNYWTSAQTESAINQATSGKQDTLIAGDNITISGNVISASGGTIDSSLNSGSTNAVANSAITVALNSKSSNNETIKSYSFGASNNVNYLKFTRADNANLSEIYYPTINGKGILTTNSTYGKNNYDFQLVESSAITSSVTSASTDAQIPTAKAVYEAETAITATIDEVEEVTAAALNALNDKFDGIKLKRISQSDYNALVSAGTVDASTLYIITQ